MQNEIERYILELESELKKLELNGDARRVLSLEGDIRRLLNEASAIADLPRGTLGKGEKLTALNHLISSKRGEINDIERGWERIKEIKEELEDPEAAFERRKRQERESVFSTV